MYFETITGIISPEDQSFVQQELEDNAAFRQIWLTLEKEGQNLKVEEFSKLIDENEALQEVKTRLNQRQQDQRDAGNVNNLSDDPFATAGNLKERAIDTNENKDSANKPDALGKTPSRMIRHMWRWAAAVFVLACLSGLGYWITRSEKITNIEKIASIVRQDKKEIELQLASGKKVAIAAQQPGRTIQIKGGAIALNTDSLTFNAADTAQNLLTVPGGRFYRITLGDGTKITLNSSTSLRFPFHFTGATREVYVDGEAYFSVTKDPAHPFIVHTPLTSIRVLGTKFNVNTYQKGAVKAALVEGSISTKDNSSARKPILLRPGNEASFEVKNGFKTHAFDKDDVLSWLDGVYYFHNMTIDQLAKVISRNFGVPVTVADAKTGARSVTGVMNRSNLPELLSDLSVTAGVRPYYKDDHLYLQ
ncbi:FecR family protein [Arachidicoccus terrestris]|uniref:FecR family protein n=1 Tax=Arachidicoccus terrestris TaxID=2875539 RepID=UPI001CC63CF9|nr:FecR domain-containing protein [Arachidicoccus terrestris]UAY56943.1 FecR domain-containing protein [Arachidicoccus terrestris]